MVNESDVMRRKARALGKTVPPWQDDLKDLEHFLCALYGDKESLRGSDCKYRESADKLRKSKILITCQKNTFGVLSSKILLKPSGILLFSGNSEKRFCLIIRLKIKQIENACFKNVCNARNNFNFQ